MHRLKSGRTGTILFAFMAIVIFLSTQSSYAVEESNKAQMNRNETGNYWWINLGFLGAGDIINEHDDGLTYACSFNYLWNDPRILLTLGGNGIYSLDLDIPLETNDSKAVSSISEIGALIGTALKWRWGFLSISAGVSYVSGIRKTYVAQNDTIEQDDIETVGLSLQGQIFFTPFKYVGIGVVPFYNYNREMPFCGVTICIQFGRLAY